MMLKKMITPILFFGFLGFFVGSLMAADLSLKSKDVKNGGVLSNQLVLNGFGCKGDNVSPEFSWSNVPKGTKSFAVTLYDPDAPTGSGFWHWVVFNIPANAKGLERGAGSGKAPLPKGAIQSRTDFGKPGFGGACPPEGQNHRYQFKIYALKGKIPLDKDASGALVGFYVQSMKLGEAMIEAKYSR